MFVSGAALDPEAERCEALRQARRVRVVLGQALDVVLERVEARRREDAGLAHAAAEQLARPVQRSRSSAELATSEPDRRAEPLREADRHRVEGLRPSEPRARRSRRPRSRAARRRGGARARARGRARRGAASSSSGKMRPPASLWVFSTATTRAGAKWGSGGGRTARTSRRTEAPAGPELCDLHARERCRRPALVAQEWQPAAASHDVARARQRVERGLVGHRARRDEERRLLPEQLGGARLEAAHGRVLAVDVVAELAPAPSPRASRASAA